MSIATKIFRMTLTVLDKWLHIKLGHDQPRPMKKLYEHFNILSMQFEGHEYFILDPREEEKPKRVILFLHGGGYFSKATTHHWRIAIELAEKTHSSLAFPDYPLIPKTCKDTIRFMDACYEDIASRYTEVTIAGDSAGAGLALGFTQHLVIEKKPMPKKMVLISPWMDVSMDNPKIEIIARKDAWLRANQLKKYGQQYSDNNPKQALASPIYGEVTGLPPTIIITTDDDILDADIQLWEQKAKNTDYQLTVNRYPKMFHDFPLMGLKESKQARKEIIDFVLP